MVCELAKRECVPCKGEVPPLKGAELESFRQQLGADWVVVNEHHLEKEFKFPTYLDGVAFVSRIADIAEEQQHHPDILLVYRKVKVTLWTHKIDGLTESDFILASKIEAAVNL